MVIRKEELVIFLISLPIFLSFFIILTFCYLLIVLVKVYCYTLSHSIAHMHTHKHTHTQTHTHTHKHTHTHTNSVELLWMRHGSVAKTSNWRLTVLLTGFEPVTPVSERPKTYTLVGVATGTGFKSDTAGYNLYSYILFVRTRRQTAWSTTIENLVRIISLQISKFSPVTHPESP